MIETIKFTILTLFIFLTSCNFQNTEIIYYDNGNVKSECQMKGGKRHGKYKLYFKTGQLNELSYYENGKKKGPFTYYFRNGTIQAKGRFLNGNLYDTAWVFNKYGMLIEKQVYDSTGKTLDYYKYDKNGKVKIDKIDLLLYGHKDTISLGDTFSLEMRLVNRVWDSAKVIIGKMDTTSAWDTTTGIIMTDTFEVLHSPNYVYNFSVAPIDTGFHEFYMLLIYTNVKNKKKEELTYTYQEPYVSRFYVKNGN